MSIQACPIQLSDAMEAWVNQKTCASLESFNPDGHLQFWLFTKSARSWSMTEFHDRVTKYGYHPFQGENYAEVISQLGEEYVTSFLTKKGFSSWDEYQQSL